MSNTKISKPAKLLEILLALLVIVIVTIGMKLMLRHYYRAAYPVHYSEAVERFSAENDLPPSLVYAVIRTESGFNPGAHSSVGARGLMQITEETFDWIAFREGEPPETGFDDLLDEETNIRFGTALLRMHLGEFGTVENALCAYHAGRTSLQNWLRDPNLSPDGEHVETIPFGDTNRYVKKVIETKKMYQALYDME